MAGDGCPYQASKFTATSKSDLSVAHNAGIGFALFSRHGRRRAVDTMRTDQPRSPHSGVRHVTIVAATAPLAAGVCVRFDVGRVLNVAIQAHLSLGLFLSWSLGSALCIEWQVIRSYPLGYSNL